MNSDILVSIIIPSYNHALYIEQSIRSVLNQTHKNIELIVIDDGSTDESVKIINQIQDIRLSLYQQENQGAHNAINYGCKLATGDYLAILNSDDIFYPNRLELILDFFDLNPMVDLVSSYIEIINDKGESLTVKKGWRNLEPWPYPDNKINYRGTNKYELNLLSSNFVSTTSNIIIIKLFYQKVGGMRNLRFAHDWDFLLRAAMLGKCAQIEEVLLKYRIHATNTISTNRKWMLFEICWIIAINMHKFGDYIFSDILNEHTLSKDLSMFLGSINTLGNDKLIYAMLIFMETAKNKNIENYEELFLNNTQLRNIFIDKIID